MHFVRLRPAAILGAVAIACIHGGALAQTTTLFSTSFESPTFTSGSPLAGTGGFSALSDVQYAVTNVRANTGTQSVSLNTNGLQGNVWSWVDLVPNAGSAAQPFLVGRVSIFIDTATAQVGGNSGFGLDAYSESVARLGAVRILGNGVVELFQGNEPVATGLTADLNQWNTLELILHPGLGTATARLNSTFNSSTTTTFAPGTAVADIDLYSAPLGFETGYFDDYRITQQSSVGVVAVPEPATFALLGLGTVAMIGMIRRRKGTCA